MPVNIQRKGRNLRIQVDDPIIEKMDHELIEGCIQAVLECCNTSGCCDGRIAINEQCLETVARHNQESNCISSCFGCA